MNDTRRRNWKVVLFSGWFRVLLGTLLFAPMGLAAVVVDTVQSGSLSGPNLAAGVICLILTGLEIFWLTRYEPPTTR